MATIDELRDAIIEHETALNEYRDAFLAYTLLTESVAANTHNNALADAYGTVCERMDSAYKRVDITRDRMLNTHTSVQW